MRTTHDQTPLTLVADHYILNKEKSFSIADLLIKNGASILAFGKVYKQNFIDKIYKFYKQDAHYFAFQAFKWALENNSKDRLKELCNHNSPAMKEGIDFQDELGNTLLHVMVTSLQKNLCFVRLLLKAGANPNIANNAGFTPLHMALQQDDKILFGLLLSCKADMTIPFPEPQELNSFLAVVNKPLWLNLLLQVACQKNPAME